MRLSRVPNNRNRPCLGFDSQGSANQAWATDITYIPMAKGFCYLVAIIDWATRKVLSWKLSNSLDVSFCIDTLKAA